MKLTDMLVSAILKKGIMYEARNVDMEFTIPQSTFKTENIFKNDDVKIRFKAEHVSIQIDKGELGA